MYCTECGHELSPDQRFCTACGAPVQDAEPDPGMDTGPADTAEAPAEWTCAVCGASNESDFVFCVQCGIPRADEAGTERNDWSYAEADQTIPFAEPLSSDQAIPAEPVFPQERYQGAAAQATSARAAATKKSRAPLIIACVVAFVVAFAVAAFVVAGGDFQDVLDGVIGESSDQTEESTDAVATASYASDEVVDVSESTTIIPTDASGDVLTSYVVRVKQADDLDGAAIDPTTLPNLSVDGSGGFRLSDFGDVESGTYYLSITDSLENVYDLPPVSVDNDSADQDDLPDSLEVSAPSLGGSLSKQGKYACYLNVLDGLIGAYGDASLGVLKLDDSQYLSWVAGVSYAGLVDFGDGVERLVVMYCTDESLGHSDVIELDDETSADDLKPTADSYRIEVWEYDSDADEAVMLCQLKPTEAAEDGLSLTYLTNPTTGFTCLYASDGSSSPSAEQCYGVDGSGSFGVVSSSTDCSRWTTAGNYLVSHTGTTQDAALDDAGTNETSCEGTAQTVKDLLAKLQTICGA